ncbi:hypothetical protein BG011_000999 [Mortierella polycephala]|uniref:Tyrosine specific protein phosphatases domain-containing protein n=1 Tax=Mortierella polycephala TaxID=41804 RepID=A0A9P6Q689_9FUNG|nr:hypothetical protein BG011_000999 [Mortierella polycephala]
MATFHSLSPSLGSHQNRLVPDLFSIELELALPQDHFLPAQNIEAQVWTNIIHKNNPDGPEVWAAVPMKLSHVTPGKSIAVFAARFQPTGRGDFGLTARWKSHKEMKEWQWAPTETGSGDQKVNRDVSVSVKVPRNIAESSSWTIGPQSVLVYGQHGPRVEGYRGGAGVGGPGLYLGNHAAATRARISGYEAVLSLIGDVLDFDENIPESDKDVNKSVWDEQAKAKEAASSPPRRFSALSRPSSVSAYGISLANGTSNSSDTNGAMGLTRRSSVTDFMVHYEPGSGPVPDGIIAAVVDEPVDPSRLTRKSSVADKMVQAPALSKHAKRMSRSSASKDSFASIDELEQLERGQDDATPTTLSSTAAAPNSASRLPSISTNGASNVPPPSAPATSSKKSHGKKGSNAAANAATPGTSAGTKSATLSKKDHKNTPSSSSAATLPPTSSGDSAKTGTAPQAPTSSSPTISSLAVAPAIIPDNSSALTASLASGTKDAPTDKGNSATAKTSTKETEKKLSSTSVNSATTSNPPSSAKVVSGLQNQSQMSSSESQAGTNSNNSGSSSKGKNRAVDFKHKVISLAPGAQNQISDAVLKEAIEFLTAEVDKGKKVMVHCRDGHGRSGSIAIAYIAARKQLERQKEMEQNDGDTKGKGKSVDMTANRPKDGGYDEALKEVWKWKCDVYPHKGLRQSLERIQW